MTAVDITVRRRRWSHHIGEGGDAEVGNVHTGGIRQYVARLEVAVDDAGTVGGRQRTSQLPGDCRHIGGWDRPEIKPVLQALVDQSHHDVGAAGLPPIVVDRDDVGVRKVRNDLRFGIETSNEVEVVGQFRAQRLDRHLATDARLQRSVDRAVCALANELTEAVAAQSSSRRSAGAKRRIVCCDASAEPSDLLRWLEPDLGESLLERFEAAKGLSLTTGAVQRNQVLASKPLTERVLFDLSSRRSDNLLGRLRSEECVVQLFERDRVQFVEP